MSHTLVITVLNGAIEVRSTNPADVVYVIDHDRSLDEMRHQCDGLMCAIDEMYVERLAAETIEQIQEQVAF
jgi:hypothetical protein